MVAEGVAGLGDKAGTEGCKTRLDGFTPSGKVSDSAAIIGSDGNTVGTGLTSLKLEGIEGGSVEVVGDTVDLFELIIHDVLLLVASV